jgi:hypothetical protein
MLLQLVKRFQMVVAQSHQQPPRPPASDTPSDMAHTVADAAVPLLPNSRSFGTLLCHGNPLRIGIKWVLCVSVVAANEDVVLLELQDVSKLSSPCIPNPDLLMTGNIMGRIRAGTSILSTVSAFCDAVMDILPPYNRGMVYR